MNEQLKKKIYKRWWFWVLVPVALLVVAGQFLKLWTMMGASMEPTLHNNDPVIILKLFTPARGEIVMIRFPMSSGFVTDGFIKRIIGIPGEKIDVKDGRVFINGQQLNEPYVSQPTDGTTSVTLGDNQFFVMGDNRAASYDSRRSGPVSRNNIVGRVLFR